jgi:hypothetical protein
MNLPEMNLRGSGRYIATVFLVMGLNAAWASEPFAVVELFGSEGCSSCPPADHVLSELTYRARAQKERIFTLSFHVDYWNYLGWKDPFSSKQFTQRQYQYAESLKNTSVYTPQMIINGKEAFVGSNRSLANQLIEDALRIPASNSVHVELTSADQQDIIVSYTCEHLNPATVIHFALVQDGLENKVTAGENSGHILKHDHVVRDFKTIPLNQLTGTVNLTKPSKDSSKLFTVIAYLQDERSMRIFAADSVDF